jgi:hypothetical protein
MLRISVRTDVNYGRSIASGRMVEEPSRGDYARLIVVCRWSRRVCPVYRYVRGISTRPSAGWRRPEEGGSKSWEARGSMSSSSVLPGACGGRNYARSIGTRRRSVATGGGRWRRKYARLIGRAARGGMYARDIASVLGDGSRAGVGEGGAMLPKSDGARTSRGGRGGGSDGPRRRSLMAAGMGCKLG